VDHYELADILLIGHSMGGKTAMQFACDYPGRVRKLLVADIAPKYYPPHHKDIIQGLNSLDLQKIRSRKEAEEELGRHITDSGIRQFLLKNLYRETKDKLAFRFNLEVLSTKQEEIGDNLGSSDMYSGPTLFLRGDRSEYVSTADLPLIKSHFPMANIEAIPNAGHWLHAENPEQFLERSMHFFRS
jgi:pimeloyl-ACP methyl ester carboxylesterase